jgi:hypothetical protein
VATWPDSKRIDCAVALLEPGQMLWLLWETINSTPCAPAAPPAGVKPLPATPSMILLPGSNQTSTATTTPKMTLPPLSPSSPLKRKFQLKSAVVGAVPELVESQRPAVKPWALSMGHFRL